MYDKLTQCPVCNGTEFKNEIICKDHTVSDEQFVLVRCISCGLLFTNPRPVEQQLGKYYQSDQYISHTSKGNSLINKAYKIARFFTLRSKYKLVSSFAQHGKMLLDYGCGTGHFLTYLKEKRWKVTGVEPDNGARAIASKHIHVLSNISEIDPKVKYDVITLWHVLEHVPDLNTTLEKLKEHLHTKGTLIVAVPNANSWDAQHYKEYWAGYDVPRHLYHFNQKSLKELMKHHKLKVRQILPMKLDSFYVSMLSEKYKSGKTNYIKSIVNGYTSNSYARKNQNNYSSLIYIIQK